MAMNRTCMYCGRRIHSIGRGEHIIPEAIGGARTIKTVCGNCNNAFSDLDRELCSRSPLSIVASQELDTAVWQVWDVDHSAGHLLLEARPDWSANALTECPQIVFEASGPQIRGDYEEIRRFGSSDFVKVLVKAALRAFQHYEAGEKRWLHLERLDPRPIQMRGYRLPPRVCARRSIGEIANTLARNKRVSLTLRYLSAEDKRRALNSLDNWDHRAVFRHCQVGIGSQHPAVRHFYDATKVWRALAKISLNLLSDICVNTPVDLNTAGFRECIHVISGAKPLTQELFYNNGFIYACDAAPVGTSSQGHFFRVIYDRNWHVISSFFNGRIGASLRFRGPNYESWCCAEIHAPLRSAQWCITTSHILPPPKTTRIEWKDPAKIIPSVPLLNVVSELVIMRAP